MDHRLRLLYFGLILLFLGQASCSLDRPIQSPRGKTAEELYKKGSSEMEQKNYRQALEAFYKLKYDFPTEAAAVMADLKIADAHYANKEYAEAAEGYEEVRKMHPASPYIPYVVYMLGMCHFNRSLTVDRDQTETEKALAEFQYLLTHFSNTPYAYDAYEKAQECMKKLSDHEVYVGNFYYRMNKYQAAIQRYEAALAKYPSVPLEDEVLFKLAEAYRATKQPEKAVRAIQALVQQYPKSKYAQRGQRLLEGDLAKVQVAAANPVSIQETSKPSGGVTGPSERSAPGKIDLGKASSSQAASGDGPQVSEPQDMRGFAPQRDPGKAQEDKQPQSSSKSTALPSTRPVLGPENEVKSIHKPTEPELQHKDLDPQRPEGDLTRAKPSPEPMAPQSPKQETPHAEVQEVRKPEASAAGVEFPLSRDESKAAPLSEVGARSQKVTHADSQTAAKELEVAGTPAESSGSKASSSVPSPLGGAQDRSRGRPFGKEEGVGFGELRSDKPINITADRMDAFQRENRVVFEGHVVVQQEETYLYAQRIVADMAPQEQGGGIRKVVAQDDVRITQNDRVATCDRAEFDHLKRTIELHGNPKIWQGKDWIDGEKVLVQLDQEKMVVVGSDKKRVSAVLHPKAQKVQAEESSKPQEFKPRPKLTAPFATASSGYPAEVQGGSTAATASASSRRGSSPVVEKAQGSPTPEKATPQACAVSESSLRAEEKAAKIAAQNAPPPRVGKVKEQKRAKNEAGSVTRDVRSAKERVSTFVERWRKAWESKDVERFMSFYSKRFRSGKMDRNAWRAYKEATFRKAGSIQVTTEAIRSKRSGGTTRVSFVQSYKADHHQDLGQKELELVVEDGQWKIIRETWRPLGGRVS